jgi:hypothetical protein
VTGRPLDLLRLYFAPLPTRQGVLARAALGESAPDDAELAARLAEALASEIRPDGSIGGAAVPTIWRAHELLDLGRDPGDPGLARLTGWLLERQDMPGAFGSGCDKARHAQRICAHYVCGFFAPAPPEQRLAPITLPNGKAFRAEPAARFAISSLALRAVLRLGLEAQPLVRQHLESLANLTRQWTVWSGFFAPDALVAGLHALALAGPGYRPVVEGGVAMMAAHQEADGGWPQADLFHLIEALLAAGGSAAHASVRRALPALIAQQRADGTFGASAQQERALIGLRAIRWSEAPL